LWAFNGQTTYQVAEINPLGSSWPKDFLIHNEAVYFRANDPTGDHIFRYDSSGVNKIHLYPDTGYSPSVMAVLNDQIHIGIRDENGHAQLARINEDSLYIISNSDFGLARTGTGGINACGGNLYFSTPDTAYLYNIWSYNEEDITQVTYFSEVTLQHYLTCYQDDLYFAADDGVHGQELFRISETLLPFIELEPSRQPAIYPNPVKDILYATDKGEYKLYDLEGTLMLQGENIDGMIEVASLKPGLYIYVTAQGKELFYK
jgi:hypothetical protein